MGSTEPAVVLADTEGVIHFGSPAATERFGHRADHAAGRGDTGATGDGDRRS